MNQRRTTHRIWEAGRGVLTVAVLSLLLSAIALALAAVVAWVL